MKFIHCCISLINDVKLPFGVTCRQGLFLYSFMPTCFFKVNPLIRPSLLKWNSGFIREVGLSWGRYILEFYYLCIWNIAFDVEKYSLWCREIIIPYTIKITISLIKRCKENIYLSLTLFHSSDVWNVFIVVFHW
jgi:hypothetical protein